MPAVTEVHPTRTSELWPVSPHAETPRARSPHPVALLAGAWLLASCALHRREPIAVDAAVITAGLGAVLYGAVHPRIGDLIHLRGQKATFRPAFWIFIFFYPAMSGIAAVLSLSNRSMLSVVVVIFSVLGAFVFGPMLSVALRGRE